MEAYSDSWKEESLNFCKDEFYESFRAPKWFDFSSLDCEQSDSEADSEWFCTLIECDKKHLESSDKKLHHSFSAKSPGLASVGRCQKPLRKRKLIGTKSPMSAPTIKTKESRPKKESSHITKSLENKDPNQELTRPKATLSKKLFPSIESASSTCNNLKTPSIKNQATLSKSETRKQYTKECSSNAVKEPTSKATDEKTPIPPRRMPKKMLKGENTVSNRKCYSAYKPSQTIKNSLHKAHSSCQGPRSSLSVARRKENKITTGSSPLSCTKALFAGTDVDEKASVERRETVSSDNNGKIVREAPAVQSCHKHLGIQMEDVEKKASVCCSKKQEYKETEVAEFDKIVIFSENERLQTVQKINPFCHRNCSNCRCPRTTEEMLEHLADDLEENFHLSAKANINITGKEQALDTINYRIQHNKVPQNRTDDYSHELMGEIVNLITEIESNKSENPIVNDQTMLVKPNLRTLEEGGKPCYPIDSGNKRVEQFKKRLDEPDHGRQDVEEKHGGLAEDNKNVSPSAIFSWKSPENALPLPMTIPEEASFLELDNVVNQSREDPMRKSLQTRKNGKNHQCRENVLEAESRNNSKKEEVSKSASPTSQSNERKKKSTTCPKPFRLRTEERAASKQAQRVASENQSSQHLAVSNSKLKDKSRTSNSKTRPSKDHNN